MEQKISVSWSVSIEFLHSHFPLTLSSYPESGHGYMFFDVK
jgi:hypothetical protein